MTIDELLAIVDDARINDVSRETKIRWICELEKTIYDEVFKHRKTLKDEVVVDYTLNTSGSVKLLCPPQFNGMYINYLFYKIDYANAEYDRATNDQAQYFALYDDMCAWATRNYESVHSPSMLIW